MSGISISIVAKSDNHNTYATPVISMTVGREIAWISLSDERRTFTFDRDEFIGTLKGLIVAAESMDKDRG